MYDSVMYLEYLELITSLASSDVIFLTYFHSSPSASTIRCFCMLHTCAQFRSSLLLTSVHNLTFMAHDLRAPRNLDSELPLRINVSSFDARVPDAYKSFNHRAIGPCYDECVVGIGQCVSVRAQSCADMQSYRKRVSYNEMRALFPEIRPYSHSPTL